MYKRPLSPNELSATLNLQIPAEFFPAKMPFINVLGFTVGNQLNSTLWSLSELSAASENIVATPPFTFK
jgi:hypothetical protein